MTQEIREFIDLEQFEKIKTFANYFVEQKAFPKGVDNVAKLVMILQAGKDLGLSVTSCMSGLCLINGIVTVYGNVGALVMKKSGYDWKVIEWNSKKCKIKIWKGRSEEEATKTDEVEYTIEEATHAWIVKSDPWIKYPQEMIYWKCLARARKRVCPEVLDGVAIFEDYQEMEKETKVIDADELLKDFATEETTSTRHKLKKVKEQEQEVVIEQDIPTEPEYEIPEMPEPPLSDNE